jgi:hypothetical protein
MARRASAYHCPGHQRINPERKKCAHIHQLEALGYKVTLEPVA